MWRVYFFDQHMEIVEQLDRLTTKRNASAWGARYAKRHGYYSYAVGAIR